MRTSARVTIHTLLVLLNLFALQSSALHADTLDEIRQRGTLRWGGDASGGGPYIYEGQEHKLTGFEYDLAEYLAAKLGVRAEFVQWEWENLPLILTSGKIDVVLNGFEWSAEREQLWSSTIPYYIYKLQLLTRADDGSINSWDDLRTAPGRPRMFLIPVRNFCSFTISFCFWAISFLVRPY